MYDASCKVKSNIIKCCLLSSEGNDLLSYFHVIDDYVSEHVLFRYPACLSFAVHGYLG